MKLFSERLYILLLFVIAILSFWQVAFLQYPLKYDMIDCSYPWRFIVAEHLQHGMLPLWNPYQGLGYPLFADIQSGASWYLPVWVIGYFFGYNIYTLSAEFVLHIFAAGLGMFFLGKSLRLSLHTSFLMGCAYMLSGFFTAHAQHFTLIAGATWLPYITAWYINIYKNGKLSDVILLALFIFLFVSGGYPTYIIITFYLLSVLTILMIIKLIKQNQIKRLKHFLKNSLLLLVFTISICAVVIVSISDIAQEITRTAGVSLDATMLNPFSPQSAISFLLPYATINDMAFYNTDMSMSNAYIGIVILGFFIFGFFIRFRRERMLFLLLGIVFMLIAMGDYLPLRQFLYDHIPFMNMFRFPSVLRLYTVFGFIVFSAYAIEYFLQHYQCSSKKLRYIALSFVILFVAVIIYARTTTYLEIRNFIQHAPFNFASDTYRMQHIAFQSFIQICVMTALFLILFFVKKRTHAVYAVSVLLIFEMLLAVHLNAPYTVYEKKFKQKDVYAHHKAEFVKGFDSPKLQPIKDHNDAAFSYGPFWRNMSNFHKVISKDAFTSLILNNYNDLLVNYPDLLNKTIKKPHLFLTHQVAPMGSYEKMFCKKDAFIPIAAYTLPDIEEEKATGGHLEVVSFKPTEVIVKTNTNSLQMLVFVQNYYRGWQVFVNNKEVPLIKTNVSMMGTMVPKGENLVVFSFEKPYVVKSFKISSLSLFVIIIFLLYKFLFKKIKKTR